MKEWSHEGTFERRNIISTWVPGLEMLSHLGKPSLQLVGVGARLQFSLGLPQVVRHLWASGAMAWTGEFHPRV